MSIGLTVMVAVVALVAGMGAGRSAPRVWLGVTLLGLAAWLAAAVAVLTSTSGWEWHSEGWRLGGEMVTLRLDAISGMFLALLSVIGGAGTLYSREYWNDRQHPRSAGRGRIWWNVMLLNLALVLLASNGLHFLIAWELFTLAAYFLITLDRQNRAVRAAGWLYLGASHVAVLALFGFFTLLAVRTGSWQLRPMTDRPELAPLFWLALLGFGIKAGVFPLHIWLPSAHASAPSHVSAMLSGVALKIGIYGLVRFSGWLPVPAAAAWTIAALGVISAVLGVAFALGQHDLKRLLAYHSVENIGIILIGLGFALVAAGHGHAIWGRLALAGGLLHCWNHGLFKALLFFGAGSVLHATGTREMSRLGGLWRIMPWTAGLFALGAAAISGLPPLNGFVSEWLVFLGLIDSAVARGPGAWAAVAAAILLGMTGALALACFIKVCGVVFLGLPRSQAATHAHEAGPAMRTAMLVLALMCVAIGLAPVVFWPAVARAVASWSGVWSNSQTVPVPLVQLGWVHLALAAIAIVAGGGLWMWVRHHGFRRAMTWDCGWVAPTARMQYTAGSFAATLTEWFGWILRPVRHDQPPDGFFPTTAERSSHTPEVVLEHVLGPVARAVLRVSWWVRQWQQGRVQAYILYVLAGLLALAAWLGWAG